MNVYANFGLCTDYLGKEFLLSKQNTNKKEIIPEKIQNSVKKEKYLLIKTVDELTYISFRQHNQLLKPQYQIMSICKNRCQLLFPSVLYCKDFLIMLSRD